MDEEIRDIFSINSKKFGYLNSNSPIEMNKNVEDEIINYLVDELFSLIKEYEIYSLLDKRLILKDIRRILKRNKQRLSIILGINKTYELLYNIGTYYFIALYKSKISPAFTIYYYFCQESPKIKLSKEVIESFNFIKNFLEKNSKKRSEIVRKLHNDWIHSHRGFKSACKFLSGEISNKDIIRTFAQSIFPSFFIH